MTTVCTWWTLYPRRENVSDFIERMVQKYGEERRRLIEESLAWLAENEPIWDLEEPMDKEKYLAELMAKSKSG